jgi:hypothetical protein
MAPVLATIVTAPAVGQLGDVDEISSSSLRWRLKSQVAIRHKTALKRLTDDGN